MAPHRPRQAVRDRRREWTTRKPRTINSGELCRLQQIFVLPREHQLFSLIVDSNRTGHHAFLPPSRSRFTISRAGYRVSPACTSFRKEHESSVNAMKDSPM
jgi:hypothetical protein